MNNESCYFRSSPMPMPMQKLPTIAKPTSQSINFPTNPQIDAPSCRRAGRKRERENNTRDGKCKGSKDGLIQNDEDESRVRLRWARESACVTVLSLSLTRLASATSCDNMPSHSASHSFLLHSDSCTFGYVRGPDRSAIARSTSRHRTKRSTASARSKAKVSGDRNKPLWRAVTEVGRKEDTV